MGWTGWRERQSRDPRALKARRALLQAKDRVRASEKAQRDGRPEKAATLLAEAIEHYLCDKLGPEAAGLPFQKTLELLRRRHPDVPDDRLSSLKGLWEELELRRFAPKAGGAKTEQQLADAALGHLQRLEKELHA